MVEQVIIMQKITDLVDIKQRNVKSIIDTVRSRPTSTKKEIASATGLSVATVSNLCNELIEMGILEGQKSTTARIGRVPEQISLKEGRFFNVVLDFRLENVLHMAIMTLQNEIYYSTTIDITCFDDAQTLINNIVQQFRRTVKLLHLENAVFMRVGAAVPAIHDSNDGRLKTSTISIIDNFPLKAALTKAFGIRAYVDNVTRFTALSVYARTHCSSPIINLDVSQGIGAGIIVNGALLRGKNGYGSEIAHVPIGRMDEICPICGRSGCAETMLSVRGMTNLIPQIPQNLPLLMRWQQFVVLMRKNADDYRHIAREIGLELGRMSTILINMFDPGLFCVSGYITDIKDFIAPFIEEEIQARCPMSLGRGLQIEWLESGFEDVYIGINEALFEGWNPYSERSSQ